MFHALVRVLFAITLALAALAGCGEKPSGMLDEISGVWRSKDATLVTFIYADKKMRMLVGDDAMPVTLGDVDNQNRTANLNLTLANGKLGVWTVRQMFNKDKTSFNLQITLHDGSQDQLDFVRKVSSDDLNRIANAEARNQPGSVGGAAKAATAASPAPAAPATAAAPAPEPTTASLPQVPVAAAPTVPVAAATVPDQIPPQVAEKTAFAPSFDCAKVSTGPERLICSDRQLAGADVQMAQLYRVALNTAPDKDALRAVQNAWRKNERDGCSDAPCMLRAYEKRISELR
jgi:uncharacterized protein YecT (DUF1311 family)